MDNFYHELASVLGMSYVEFALSFHVHPEVLKETETTCAPRIGKAMGMKTEFEARVAFYEALKKIREDGIRAKTFDWPRNVGDSLLLDETEGQEVACRMLAKARREGGLDDDIRWWWNRYDWERRLADELQWLEIVSAMREETKLGIPQDNAKARVVKYLPVFGNPDHEAWASGVNGMIPWELKLRVETYVARRQQSDRARLVHAIESSSSFNALIRKEIRQGAL